MHEALYSRPHLRCREEKLLVDIAYLSFRFITFLFSDASSFGLSLVPSCRPLILFSVAVGGLTDQYLRAVINEDVDERFARLVTN